MPRPERAELKRRQGPIASKRCLQQNYRAVTVGIRDQGGERAPRIGDAHRGFASVSDNRIEEWRHVASEDAKQSWHDRALLVASLIRPGDRVCDLGAGAQTLRRHLPLGVKYIPVDWVDTPGTHVTNLNLPDYTLPPDDFNVITALGVINFLDSAETFFDRLVCLAKGKFLVFTYDLWKPEGRLGTPEGCVASFSRYVRDLRPVFVLRRRVYFTGVLGHGEPDAGFRQPTSNLFLKRLPPQEYFALKFLKLPMMPRWLA